MRRAFIALTPFVLLPLLLLPGSLAAQDPGQAPGGRPRVFFDCQGPQCDQTYYRTEITWVDWVRDPQDAHVHVIMTSQVLGGGGREYILDLIGRGASAAYVTQNRYQSRNTDTQRESLDGVAYTLSLGLAQFANVAGFRNVARVEPFEGDADDVSDALPPQGIVAPEEVDDPWNLWTFRVNGGGNVDFEATSREYRANAGFNASRTTPTWKTSLNGNWNLNNDERQRSDETWFTNRRVNWSVNLRLVYSIAEHWSVGVTGGPARQEQQNQHVRVQLNPAIEYSFFPYEEATRRSLTAFYQIGPVYRGYIEETIYGQDSEVLVEEAFTLDFSQRQPWGNASVSATFSNYIHDANFYNLSLFGFVSYRITRGINVNLNARVSKVHDQIFLSGEDLTEEERLFQVRQLATDYDYGGSLGLSWQFGSIFNNVVNNRFPGGGGGGGRGGGFGGFGGGRGGF